MELRWRPSIRAIAAGPRPRYRSRPRLYLSAKVIWQYIIGSFLSWRRPEAYRVARSPFLFASLLRLLYESAAPNEQLLLPNAESGKRLARFARPPQFSLGRSQQNASALDTRRASR